MRKLRILIVDDHAIVRAGIRSLLEGQLDIEVVGEAGRGDEAIEEALQLRPELVLLDIAMPGMNGIEVTRRLKKELPDLRILILTMHDDDEFFFPLLRAGASGYVLKDTDPQQLLYAIRVVVDGQSFLSPTMAKALMDGYVAVATDQEGGRNGVLTSREREVLQLAAAGRTNREIAETLFLSVRTVEKHRQAMMRKLGLSSRDNLMKYAIRMGLVVDLEGGSL